MFSKYSGRSASTYTLEYKLSGHRDAILCMAVSDGGNLLASGGMDGLRIWDLHKRIQAAKANHTRNPRDPVTCLAWLTRKDDVQETLCAGTGLGYIILWRQRADMVTEFDEIWSRRIGTGQEIMTLTCEIFEGNPRIITATRDKKVQLWSVDSKYQMSNIFSVELPSTIPRASCFYGGDVMIFGMYNGEICTLRSKDGTTTGTHTTGRMIGGAAIDQTRTHVVIDNGVVGYSLHRVDDGMCSRTYETRPKTTYPKQVAFAEKGDKIVGGGDDGRAYIFHKASGMVHQVLRHSATGRVQTVMAYEGDVYYLIATASSGNDQDAKISIWKKRIPSTKRELDRVSSWTILGFIQMTVNLLAFSMVALIVYHQIWCSHSAIGLMEGLWARARASEPTKLASWQELYGSMGNGSSEGSQANDDIERLNISQREATKDQKAEDVPIGNSGTDEVIQRIHDFESDKETALVVAL